MASQESRRRIFEIVRNPDVPSPPPEGVYAFVQRRLSAKADETGHIFTRRSADQRTVVEGSSEGENLIITVTRPTSRTGVTERRSLIIEPGVRDVYAGDEATEIRFRVSN
jgi:hypothetical protein